jgi:hypothetical protein
LVVIEASAKEDEAFEEAAAPLLQVVPYPVPPITSKAMDRQVSHEYFSCTVYELEEYGVFIEVRAVGCASGCCPCTPCT